MAKLESSKLFRTLKTMILVAVIVAASIGGTMLYYQKSGAANAGNAENAPEVKTTKLPDPIFTALEPFTVTLHNDETQRILYVGITLRMTDEASRHMVTEYMPEVRDRVLKKLSEQLPDRVQTPEGRQALVQSLTAALQEPYLPHNKGPDITSVLFTAFVVQ